MRQATWRIQLTWNSWAWLDSDWLRSNCLSRPAWAARRSQNTWPTRRYRNRRPICPCKIREHLSLWGSFARNPGRSDHGDSRRAAVGSWQTRSGWWWRRRWSLPWTLPSHAWWACRRRGETRGDSSRWRTRRSKWLDTVPRRQCSARGPWIKLSRLRF